MPRLCSHTTHATVLVAYALALFSLSGFAAGCADARVSRQGRPNNDAAGAALSTDEAVIAEMQKRVDAENAERAGDDERLAAKLRAARRLGPEDVCIERPKESARVVVVGFFRNDYGCHFEGAFVGSRYYEGTEPELHRDALEAFGWRDADEKVRERLALAWVEGGPLAFFNVLHTKPKELEVSDFHPPRAASAQDGTVTVTLWFQVPPGRSPEKGFQHVEYRFKGDGNLSGVSTLAAVLARRT